MRKAILAGAFGALVAAAAPASAQTSPAGWNVGLGGGVTLPMGDAGDAYKTGFHGTALVGYRMADSKLWLGADAQYHHFTTKDNGVTIGDLSANSFAAFGRANYDVASTAYVLGGVGLFRTESKVNFNGTTVKQTDSNMAIEAGVGLNLGKSLFVEGKFINVFIDGGNSQFIPLTLGVRF